jgi:uncharacterized protein (TIGR00369 family)
VTTEMNEVEPAVIRERAHDNCVVCSDSNTRGFGLEFRKCKDGSVVADFSCEKAFEGYKNVLHGGVIACLLDGAMTNCLFAKGRISVTAEMKIRFQHPVLVGVPASLRAWIERSRKTLHMVKAELHQDQILKATAEGKFMECLSSQLELEEGN